MKGQFFIIASVIIVFSMVGLISYIYDFGSINISEIEEMGELEYISCIKDSLNKTVYSSFSGGNCDKLRTDLTSTKNLLEGELKKRGISLVINYTLSCPPPNARFNFSITTGNLYTLTEFKSP